MIGQSTIPRISIKIFEAIDAGVTSLLPVKCTRCNNTFACLGEFRETFSLTNGNFMKNTLALIGVIGYLKNVKGIWMQF